VPIFSDNGALLGVFETYKRADALYRDLRQARIIVLLGALGGGLLLYLALFTMVRQAARKIQEQQANLLRMQAELIASQRLAAIGEMAAAVAHGIGNPLSAIRALAQVAVLESESAAGSTLQNLNTRLQNIVGQVDRVQKRMQGLLNLAKPVEPFPIMVDVNKLLRDIVDGLRPQLDQAGVAAQLELDAGLPPVELDPTQLEQVFTGLIDNAVEASSPGGEVTISTQAADANGSGKELRVCIEDTGAGIPAANRERVFEPFFTTKPQGTGLGLALAKKFVERNGGIIKILEGPRGGAKIEVIFAR
jgi:two-component system sensor histidine kinase HydH